MELSDLEPNSSNTIHSIALPSSKEFRMEAAVPEDGSLSSISELSEPWHLIQKGHSGDLHHIATKSTHHYSTPAFDGKYFCYVYYEWIVVRDRESPDCCLFNVVSQESIQLPPVSFKFSLFILSSHPADPACRVVLYDKDKKALAFCRPGDDKFVRHKTRRFRRPSVFTIAAGKIYFLSKFYDLTCVEFEDSTCCIRRLKLRRRDWTVEWMSAHALFSLAAYSGDFFLVRRCFYEDYNDNLTRFQVFKADFSREEWVEVKSIAPLTIFLMPHMTSTSHVCCPTIDSGIMSNALYFLEDYGTEYYSYRLDEESITMYGEDDDDDDDDVVENANLLTTGWMVLPRDTHLLPMEGNKLKEEVGSRSQDSTLLEEDDSWANLPPELLSEILSHLLCRDYAVCHAVCKSWQQITTQPSPISSSIFHQEQEEPLLMFLEDRDVPVYKLFDPIHRKYQRLEIPELKGADIRYSKHGWLLVSRKSDASLFFLNPFTREKIAIPSQRFLSDINLYFSSPPTSSDCLIVAVWGFPQSVSFMTLRRGENSWSLNVVHDTQLLLPSSSPVVHKGLHYYACQDGRVVAFDFSGDESKLANIWSTSLQRGLTDEKRYDEEDFMVEIDGVPALVVIPRGGADSSIDIFKWDLIMNDWVRMEDTDLGNKDMFLSRRSSFLKTVYYGGGMGNKIFLNLVDTDNMDGVFYSLKTQMYHTFYSGYCRKKYSCAAKFHGGIWVEPLYTRSSEDDLTWCSDVEESDQEESDLEESGEESDDQEESDENIEI